MSSDNELVRLHNAVKASIAGHLDSWAVMLEDDPEMKNIVIKDMKKMATSLKKSAGVIFANDPE